MKKIYIITFNNEREMTHEGTLSTAKTAASKQAKTGEDIRIYEGKMQLKATKWSMELSVPKKGKKTAGKPKWSKWIGTKC